MGTVQTRARSGAWAVGLCWLVCVPEVSAWQEERRSVPPPRVVPGLMLESSRGAPADVGPRLEPIGGGRLRHRGKGFTAIIDADGSVEFRDVLVEAKPSFMGFDLRGNKNPPVNLARDNFEERALYPTGPPTAPILVGVGGCFGGIVGALIGAVVRKARGGKSPGHRHTAAKLQFIKETEAPRLRMMHAWLKARLAAQLDVLIAEVLAAWRDTSLPLVERRRRIFIKWDECEDGGGVAGSAIEQIRADAATLARARIEALVRLLAPAGSPQAYAQAELVRLNAGRRSRSTFDPYGASARANGGHEVEALEQPPRDEHPVSATPP